MSFDDEPVRLMCSLLLPSEGVPVCCDCCASLYTSHTASILLTRLRCHSMKLFLSSIELLTLTCASVFVFCVLLSLCLVCFCLCVLCASAWKLPPPSSVMLWIEPLVMAGYGWL